MCHKTQIKKNLMKIIHTNFQFLLYPNLVCYDAEIDFGGEFSHSFRRLYSWMCKLINVLSDQCPCYNYSIVIISEHF